MEIDRDTNSFNSLKKDLFLASHYELQSMLGSGCFGKIVKAVNKRTGQLMAIKIEKYKKSRLKMVLKNQIEILKKLQGKPGIPRIYGSGDWENGTYLEMDLLGHDLNRGHQYSSSEIIDLTREALKVLEGIHSCNIIHQDLKPHNFMRDKNGDLFIIDFGLSRQLPLRTKVRPSLRGFIGTPRYASIRAHNLLQQGKKDDLESLFYNLAYLYYHKLPWSKLNVPNEQRLEKIKLLKVKHGSSLFAEMPPQFQRAFDYIVSLEAHHEPDYIHLKSYFRRNKTVIMQPNFLMTAQHQRNNVKRVSLNASNFLQVPEPSFMMERLSKQKRDSDCQIKRSPSATSISIFSDALQTHLMDFEEDDEENFKEDENIEPELPSSFKMNSIVFKNPFS